MISGWDELWSRCSLVEMNSGWHELWLMWYLVETNSGWFDLLLGWFLVEMNSGWDDILLRWTRVEMISCWDELLLRWTFFRAQVEHEDEAEAEPDCTQQWSASPSPRRRSAKQGTLSTLVSWRDELWLKIISPVVDVATDLTLRLLVFRLITRRRPRWGPTALTAWVWRKLGGAWSFQYLTIL